MALQKQKCNVKEIIGKHVSDHRPSPRPGWLRCGKPRTLEGTALLLHTLAVCGLAFLQRKGQSSSFTPGLQAATA